MQTVHDPKKVVASAVISELQSSDMYLTLVARLFDLRANLNGVRVTEAFLDEIIENESKYVCHPLYADIRGLLANKTVGHMYNKRTGEFYSTQIGAFYHFEKEVDGDNAYLLGYARVPKRNKALCKVLSDLFTDNALKFSFELNCGSYAKEADGTMLIDAAEENYWEGECVVTFPACETAIAKQLVAECLEQGDENMADENIVNAEIEKDEEAKDAKQTETAETQTAESELAETVYVTQNHVEHDSVRTYNPDTGEETEQHVTVDTTVRTPIELAEEDKADEDDDKDDQKCAAKSEDDDKKCGEDNGDDDGKKKCAEAQTDLVTLVAELKNTICDLRDEIAGIKAIAERANSVIAEQTTDAGENMENIIAENVTGDTEQEEPVLNPFMASISTPKKYSLLDREEKPARKYSLLDRA